MSDRPRSFARRIGHFSSSLGLAASVTVTLWLYFAFWHNFVLDLGFQAAGERFHPLFYGGIIFLVYLSTQAAAAILRASGQIFGLLADLVVSLAPAFLLGYVILQDYQGQIAVTNYGWGIIILGIGAVTTDVILYLAFGLKLILFTDELRTVD